MIEFEYDAQLRARVATFSGTVDDAELLGAYDALLSAPDYDATLNDLVDMRGVERLEVSADAVRDLVRAFVPVELTANPTRLAIIAGSDLVYGMARMYEMLSSETPEEIRVFRDADAARAWLRETVKRPPAA